jgi:hypothetical protein
MILSETLNLMVMVDDKIDPNASFYRHSCVYGELLRNNYIAISTAHRTLELSTYECSESREFWNRVLEILKAHLSMTAELADVQQRLSHQILMVENLLHE